MAEVFVTFKRGFRLNLEGGTYIDFLPGPQRIDEALTKHWYVQANREDLDPSQTEFRGTEDYLEEDLALARQILEVERESIARKSRLQAMRAKAVESGIKKTIAGMTGNTEGLTSAQQELVAAAQRQAEKQAREQHEAAKAELAKETAENTSPASAKPVVLGVARPRAPQPADAKTNRPVMRAS